MFNGIAVVLAGLLSLELYAAWAPPGLAARPAVWTDPQTQDLQARSTSPPRPMVSALQKIILGRPLFDPARRPSALPAQPPSAAAAEIPRLSGVMLTPTERIAVFSPAMGAPIVVAQNSRFGIFTVLAISADGVTVKGPDGVILLRSDFSAPQALVTSTARSTVLAGGIYLSLIKIALPDTLSW